MTANDATPPSGQENGGIDFDQWARKELAASLRVAEEGTYGPVDRVARKLLEGEPVTEDDVADVRRAVQGITRLLGPAQAVRPVTDEPSRDS